MNFLVLCTGNSARSILLEYMLNDLACGRLRAYSAGSRPAGQVHPQALRLLAEKGYEVSSARSKSWDEFARPDAPRMDVIVTVCDSAAQEECPIWPGAPISVHWGLEDPAALQAPHWEAAFTAAHAILERRARAMINLPFETMAAGELKSALQEIGDIQ